MDKNNVYKICDSEASKKYWNKLMDCNIEPTKVKKDFQLDFTEFYKAVVEKVTPQIEEWEKTFGLEHACAAGCNYCCYQSIEIYNFELVPILEFIKAEKLEYLLERAVAIADLIEKELPKVPFKNGVENDREVLNFKVKYRSLNIPCMFLQDNKCSIYPVRPTNCATYFSYGKPEQCGQKDILPVDCNSFVEVEDWMLDNIISYLHLNMGKLPEKFEAFNINVLPIAIRNYIRN